MRNWNLGKVNGRKLKEESSSINHQAQSPEHQRRRAKRLKNPDLMAVAIK